MIPLRSIPKKEKRKKFEGFSYIRDAKFYGKLKRRKARSSEICQLLMQILKEIKKAPK